MGRPIGGIRLRHALGRAAFGGVRPGDLVSVSPPAAGAGAGPAARLPEREGRRSGAGRASGDRAAARRAGRGPAEGTRTSLLLVIPLDLPGPDVAQDVVEGELPSLAGSAHGRRPRVRGISGPGYGTRRSAAG